MAKAGRLGASHGQVTASARRPGAPSCGELLGSSDDVPAAAERDDQRHRRRQPRRFGGRAAIPRPTAPVASAVTTVVKFCVPALYSLIAICTACRAILTASTCTLISRS